MVCCSPRLSSFLFPTPSTPAGCTWMRGFRVEHSNKKQQPPWFINAFCLFRPSFSFLTLLFIWRFALLNPRPFLWSFARSLFFLHNCCFTQRIKSPHLQTNTNNQFQAKRTQDKQYLFLYLGTIRLLQAEIIFSAHRVALLVDDSVQIKHKVAVNAVE